MKKVKNTEDFKEKASIKHNNKYDYSKSIFKSSRDFVLISCPIHGEFLQTPHTHLSGGGCTKCGDERRNKLRRSNINDFVKKANKKHGFKYDYSNSVYINSSTKINIECTVHGVFEQDPSSHLAGNGCPKCGRENTNKYMNANPTGWTYTIWERNSKTSKEFDSFKLYVLYCSNENEGFYKIGRTFKRIRKRFDSITTMPYNYVIKKELVSDSKTIFDLENYLKNLYKNYKYTPTKSFGGSTECFNSSLPIDEVITHLSSLTTH